MFLSKNCSSELAGKIGNILRGVVIKRSSRYLGLPLGIGASKKDAFQFVEDSVRVRIESWKNSLLSTAGKEVLIKFVLQALPVYVMSCFMIPIGLCKNICRLMARFWWNKNSSNDHSLHWKAWEKMAIPKSDGGLGFLDIRTMNKALILKQLWRLIDQPELLVSKVLKARYFPNSSIFDWQFSHGNSWLWKSWSSVIPVLKDHLNILIRNGADVKISDHKWVPGIIGGKPSLRVQIDGQMFLVQDLILAGGCGWDENLVKALFLEEDADRILQINSLDPRLADQWNCSFVDKGKFSVKRTYKFLAAGLVSSAEGAECSLMAGNNKKARLRCWNLKIMGKVKHFIWTCFSNILPVNVNLSSRGLDIDIICKVCGEAEETLDHVLFQCDRAVRVWQIAPVQWNRVSQEQLSFKHWW
ncbi:Ribonuclease H-like superfamily protein [Striga hermonthica]|uniref:Ribonuclease H-like superfamily protein n=1 Tax=Striga hermonthica TaxID=68872 RepID=A0A9N7NHG9_STRHE|nr:Ribonuclease H-like superfamily protein [Striga hermonthica]